MTVWLDRTSDATWREIDRLFSGALERPPGTRRAWLETSASEPRVVDEVLLLLDEAESTGLPLETRSDGWLRSLWNDLAGTDSGADPLVGRRIGPYGLRERLGVGGMGAVYLAEREGAEFEQRVAVKLLRAGLETSDALERFRGERRILAALDHPHIATLLDGGTAPDGRPWLAMEYVKGDPITAYARSAGLDLDGVLDLFLTVADAVEHAHRHLVVHRDLKPSNILVRSDGVVKLLDFGIARLLDDETPHRTVTGSRVMTPAYAAPEQFLGEPATTATDVYQLGVLLRELLTGAPPFGSATDPREMERRILDESPERTSVALARASSDDRRRGWARRVRGDLDLIVAKALRKEPERRYGSAAALADDVRRFRTHRTVSARPDSFGYRARSLMRRRPWLAPVVGAAAVAALVYVGTLVRYTRTLERERAVSAEVESFLVELFRPADPRVTDGRTVTAGELARAGAGRLRDELSGQPEVQVRLAEVLGSAFSELGASETARDVYELRLDRVAELEGRASEAYASALTDLGVTVGNTGELAAADSLFTRALELRRRLHGDVDPRVGWTLLQRARVRMLAGDHEGAETDYDAWLPIFQAAPPEPVPDYLDALYDLYWVRIAQGRGDEAVALAESALELARRGYPDSNPVVAKQQALVANARYQMERNDEALELGHRALETYRAAYGDEGSWDEMELLGLLGNLHRRLGEPDSAVAIYRRGIAMEERLGGRWGAGLIESYQGLAATLHELGRLDESLAAWERAREVADRLMGGPNPLSGSLIVGYASALEARGDTAEALGLYADGLAQLAGSRGWRTWQVMAGRRLAHAARSDGRFGDAESRLEAALAVTETGGDDELAAAVRGDLAALYDAWGRPERAAEVRAASREGSGDA